MVAGDQRDKAKRKTQHILTKKIKVKKIMNNSLDVRSSKRQKSTSMVKIEDQPEADNPLFLSAYKPGSPEHKQQNPNESHLSEERNAVRNPCNAF